MQTIKYALILMKDNGTQYLSTTTRVVILQVFVSVIKIITIMEAQQMFWSLQSLDLTP